MLQQWKNLFFIHYKVSPSEIESHIPTGTSLDLFEGKAVLGVVGLQIGGIAFSWAPSIRYGTFNELNLRTYIQTAEGERLVYFFSLDCHSRLATFLAKTFYKLPYYSSHIEYKVTEKAAQMDCVARGNYPCQYLVNYDGKLFDAASDSQASFFVERYAFITADRNGNRYRGDLAHDPYQLYRGQVERFQDQLPRANGLELSEALLIPEGCFFSPGMPIRVIGFRRL